MQQGITQMTAAAAQDWPVPWCATENCGIPTNPDSISTGFWADCKPFGVRAVVEEQLRKSGEECPKDPLPV